VKSKVAHYRQARQLDNLDPVKYTKNEVVFTFSSFRFPDQILPLLCTQKGFKEGITLANPGSLDAVAISLGDNKVNAEAYHTTTYPEVLKTFARLIDGTPKIQTFDEVTSTFHNVPVVV